MNQAALEGRLAAHRRILPLIVRGLAGSLAGGRLEAALRDRSTLQDGQGDPGAVGAPGLGLGPATADGFRRVVEALGEQTHPASPGLRAPQ